jgi:hypothetical protein
MHKAAGHGQTTFLPDYTAPNKVEGKKGVGNQH